MVQCQLSIFPSLAEFLAVGMSNLTQGNTDNVGFKFPLCIIFFIRMNIFLMIPFQQEHFTMLIPKFLLSLGGNILKLRIATFNLENLDETSKKSTL